MQKTKNRSLLGRVHFRHCSFVAMLLLVAVCANLLAAEKFRYEALYRLYKQNQFSELKQQLGRVSASNPGHPEILFYQAVFFSDAEKARQQYLQVYEKGSKSVKILAAKKLKDYFYAKGYYVNATRYEKFVVDNTTSDIPQIVHNDPKVDNDSKTGIEQGTYYIQVGAFSIRDNARQRCDILAKQNIPSELITRQINGNKLFCVWIKGKPGFEETLKSANEIKAKYDLEFRIIKK